MEEIIFRKATLDDIPYFVQLRQQQLQEEGAVVRQDISIALTEYFKENIQSGNFVSWLAIFNNNIIATSGISFYTLPPHYGNVTGKVGQIASMYTLKSYRKKGIAKKLLGMVVDEAKNRECSVIRVTASDMGMFLYKSFGFCEKNNLLQYII